MKGLLCKDVYLFCKYCRSYLLIMIIFAAASVFSDNSLFQFYPCILFGLLPVTLQSYDEREKWTIYSGTLPYTRAQLVSAKYLIGLILIILTLVPTIAAHAVRTAIQGSADWESFYGMAILIFAVGLLSPAVLLPLVFRFGTEKARIAYYFVIALAFGMSTFLGMQYGFSLSFSHKGGLWLVVAGALLLYALSWFLSVILYEKREM